VDRESAGRLHANDRKRLLRALEVHAASGRPISALQQQWTAGPDLPFVAVGLRRGRDDLRDRIARRVRRMLEQGLLDEVRALDRDGRLGPTAIEAIGVKELLPLLRRERETGTLDVHALDAAAELIRARTWQLARRQTTWWKRFPDVTWLDVAPDEEAEHTGKRVATAFTQRLDAPR
jgi:tRNA dimethylallyltransferase